MSITIVAWARHRAAWLCLTVGTVWSGFAHSPLTAQERAAAPSSALASWDVTRTRGRTRTIDFVTSEGTFESVDISPDGRWIVFDLLGHIYRVSSNGGDAECLTQVSGAALNYHPRYSPDGTRIAFVSDRRGGQDNLWLMNEDGSNPRPIFLDRGSRIRQPMWMPDGHSIVAVRVFPTVLDWEFHRTTLAQFPVDGGKPHELLSSPSWQYYWPAVTGDGRYLYFYRSTMLRDQDGVVEHQQLQRLELASGVVRDVTERKRTPLFRGEDVVEVAPEASPDGRWLAFGRRIPGATIEIRGHEYGVRTALWLRDLRTGGERVVMDPIESDVTEGNAVRHMKALPGYRWAKDGRSIVIPQGGKIRRLWLDSGKVETIPFTARVQRVISEAVRSQVHIDDGPFEPKFIRWPASSPNGQHLVFEAVGHLWIQALPNGTPKRLTPSSFRGFELTPEWSPDGRWIAFASWDDHDRGHLWRIGATGGSPERLSTEAGEYLFPAWTPDGKSIIAVRGPGATARGQWWDDNGWWELVRVPASGGEASPLVEMDRLVRPSIGRNHRVYFPEPVGRQDLLARALNGEVPRNDWRLRSVAERGISRTDGVVVPGDQGLLSPDGAWVAFVDHFDLYLAPLKGVPDGATIVKTDPRVHRLTRQGGLYPHWRNNNTLEFVSGNRYYAVQVPSGRTDTLRIHLSVPRRMPAGTIALAGARIITMENRRVFDRGTIVVRGTRIVCVGGCDSTKADRVIDLAGKTIIPGLVDMHAHHLAGMAPVIPQHRHQSAVYLAHGVTTVLDPATNSDPAFPIAELIEAGEVVGSHTYSAGDFLSGYGGTSDIRSYQDAVDHVRRLTEWGAATIKDYHQPSRVERQMLAQASREAAVTITAEGEDLFRNVAFIIDGHPGWEHNLPYTPLYGDAAKFFGQAGVEFSATLTVSSPALRGQEFYLARSGLWDDAKQRRFVPWRELAQGRYYMLRPLGEYAFPLLAEGLADVVRAGGRGAIGGHGEWPGLDAHWDLWAGALALSPMEELEVGTWQGASSVGLDHDVGSLRVGKLADLVVLEGNPLDDIHNTRTIKWVMKSGVLYDADTLDEAWPEAKPYGVPPWIDEAALRSDKRRLDHWDRR